MANWWQQWALDWGFLAWCFCWLMERYLWDCLGITNCFLQFCSSSYGLNQVLDYSHRAMMRKYRTKSLLLPLTVLHCSIWWDHNPCLSLSCWNEEMAWVMFLVLTVVPVRSRHFWSSGQGFLLWPLWRDSLSLKPQHFHLPLPEAAEQGKWIHWGIV